MDSTSRTWGVASSQPLEQNQGVPRRTEVDRILDVEKSRLVEFVND